MTVDEGSRRLPAGYRLARYLARSLLGIFYRRIETSGVERIPASGPLIVAANHQNALVDPMILMASVPRRLRPIAKAPLFRHAPLSLLLRMAGAIPVHRRQDAGLDPARNEEMFRTAGAVLREGGAILIFPEGVSQAEPTLMPLRTGAARILLGAEATANDGDVPLVPVGLFFHEPGTFRTGWAFVQVGQPVRTDDCRAIYRTSPKDAVLLLTRRLEEALRRLMVEAGDVETLRLLHVVETIRAQEDDSNESSRDAASRTAWMRRAMRAYEQLKGQQPYRAAEFRLRVQRHARDLEMAGLTDRQLTRSYSPRVVLRFALYEGLSLLLGLPLALWGIANHFLPYRLCSVVRLSRPSPDSEATHKIIAGVVLFPLCWLGEGWIVWRLGGTWLLGAFLLSLVPTGFFAMTWQERWRRFRREARGFFQFLRHRDLRLRLLVRRRAITEELAALARRAPP